MSDAPTAFGVENYELKPESEDGSLETQAGAHPFQLTTTIALNQQGPDSGSFLVAACEFAPQEAVLTKDLDFKWPEGLIGNPTVFPHCTDSRDFDATMARAQRTRLWVWRSSPSTNPKSSPTSNLSAKVFNLEPKVGEPARFGFDVVVRLCISIRRFVPVVIMASRSSANDISEVVGFMSATVTVWGVPGDPRHELGLNETEPAAVPVAADVVRELRCRPRWKATRGRTRAASPRISRANRWGRWRAATTCRSARKSRSPRTGSRRASPAG